MLRQSLLFNHVWRFFASEMACYKIIVVLGDSHLCNYLRILHYISKDIFLLSAAYWVYSHYLIGIAKAFLLSVLCEMLKVQKQAPWTCAAWYLHCIASLNHCIFYTQKRKGGILLNCQTTEIYMCTKNFPQRLVPLSKQQMKPRQWQLLGFHSVQFLLPCGTWFLLLTACKLDDFGEASEQERFITGNTCNWKISWL